VAYSNFSTSNYLEAPLGVVDINWSSSWSVMFWCLDEAVVSIETESTSGYNNATLVMYMTDSLAITRSATAAFSITHQTGDSAGKFAVFTYDGTSLRTYFNGVLATTTVGALTNTDRNVIVGRRSYNSGYTSLSNQSIALLRISATAPTAEQILEIYNAEKPLFQDGAKCTLDGTSDSVTALAYDDSNDELLVGTSGGLSVFKGLRRVDENTNAITEVAQQGNLRVEEY
jgi:hypothetical protein